MSNTSPENPPPENLVDRGFWHLRNERKHLKAAPVAFCCLFLLGVFVGWFVANKLYESSISAKDATIQQQEATITYWKDKAEKFDDALPLKKKATVLADQLIELANEWEGKWEKGDHRSELAMLYSNRFSDRYFKLCEEFDVAGQYSAKLNSQFEISPSELKVRAEEIRRVADKLK